MKKITFFFSCLFLIFIIYSLCLKIIKPIPKSIIAETLIVNKESFEPTHIKIPAIDIDAVVEHVGLALDGSMQVPQSPFDVAWFDLGVIPGKIGSAVFDGHSGYANNTPAVFDNLYKLKKGDNVYVENENGDTQTFIVREFRTYSLTEDVSAVFNSNDGKTHLNLITCSGIWNQKNKTHSTRLVVFTDKM